MQDVVLKWLPVPGATKTSCRSASTRTSPARGDRARRFCFALAAFLYLAAMPLSPAAFYVLPVANLGVMVLGGAWPSPRSAR